MKADLSLEQTALWPERALTSEQGVHLGQVLFVVMGIINPGNADQVTLKALSKLWCQALPDISPVSQALHSSCCRMQSTSGQRDLLSPA